MEDDVIVDGAVGRQIPGPLPPTLPLGRDHGVASDLVRAWAWRPIEEAIAAIAIDTRKPIT